MTLLTLLPLQLSTCISTIFAIFTSLTTITIITTTAANTNTTTSTTISVIITNTMTNTEFVLLLYYRYYYFPHHHPYDYNSYCNYYYYNCHTDGKLMSGPNVVWRVVSAPKPELLSAGVVSPRKLSCACPLTNVARKRSQQ